MKKFTALILSLLCVLSFAGCNGSGKQNVSGQNTGSVITCNDPNCTDATHHHQEYYSGKQNVTGQSTDSVIICNDPNCTDASHHHQGHHEDHHEYHHG